MADRIKKIKIKQTDGSFSDYIPIGADAKNIDFEHSGSSVESKLKKTPYYYNNVATMKLDDSLKVGDMAITLGYYEANDGGGAEYVIIDDSSLEDDGGKIHNLINGLKAQLVINESINVKWFGAKGDGATDDTNAMQAFLDYAASGIKAEIPQGQYKITDTLYIDVNSNLCPQGNVLIRDYIANNSKITIKFKRSNTIKWSDLQYIKAVISNANGGLTISNDLYSTYTSKTCIEIGNEDFNFTTFLKGVNIRNYNIGLHVSPCNFYISNFEDIVIYNCNEGMVIEGSIENAGENINFKNCVFTRNGCCVKISSPLLLKFHKTSFDFNSCVFFTTYNVNIECTSCWFEGIGNRYNTDITNYNDFRGLIFSANSDKAYQESKIIITNCHICCLNLATSSGGIFKGSSLKVELSSNVFWYAEDVWQTIVSDIDFNTVFICTDDVRECIAKNNTGRYGMSLPVFFLKSDNDIQNAFFNTSMSEVNLNTLTKDTTTIGDWVYTYSEDSDIYTGSTKIKIDTIDDIKALIITPPYNGALSGIKLIYKDYIPLKGKKWQCLSFTKGFKGSSLTYATYSVNIYDENHEFLTSFVIGTNYSSSNIDGTKWFTNKNQNSDKDTNGNFIKHNIPSNAMYYKPLIELNAIRGSQTAIQQEETGTIPTDPVYFTGFYCYNY